MNSGENERRTEFARLWHLAEPSVSAYVFAAVSRFHDAEDVVQQIAEEVARRFDQYDHDRPFVGWVLWIAKSRVIDFYRRHRRDQVSLTEEHLTRLVDVMTVQASMRSGRREALEHCLEELPERSRRLIELKYVDGLLSIDIARNVDSTAGSVRVLLTRIRNALGDCVQRRLAPEES